MSALLILAVSIPAYATEIDYVSRDSFWNWIAGSNGIAQKFVGFLSFTGTCAQSEDSYHHASSYEYDMEDGHYGCVCIYCGKVFTAYASDLSAAYNDYVETLPAQGYNSDGKLHLTPVHDYCYISCDEGGVANNYVYRYCEHYSGSLSSDKKVYPSGSTGEDKHYLFRLDCASSSITLTPLSGKTTFSYRYSRSAGFYFYFSAIAPDRKSVV